MALRVLLADESSTIKKVMQLALQDFGVEVKSVPNGLDVSSVVKTFLPDIIFADVLLTKKSGYDVCSELKMDSATEEIPVVLMWSSFMELDQQRFVQSLANGRLEKPFDADTLRSLVNHLVPRTTHNPLSAFLKFPKLPEFNEPVAPSSSEEDSLSPPEEFAQVPLYGSRKKLEEPGLASSEDSWSQQNLDKFKIQIPEEISNEPHYQFEDPQQIPPHSDTPPHSISEETQLGEVGIGTNDFEEIDFNSSEDLMQPQAKSIEPIAFEVEKKRTDPSSTNFNTEPIETKFPALSEERLLQEARSIIESICWKILPDITEKIVREELQKVMAKIDHQ